MDKQILLDYMDACELISETEADIRDLERRKKDIVQDSVRGSNPDFPYESKRFVIRGADYSESGDGRLRMERRLLESRKADAERLKLGVEAWLGTIPMRMQRIIRYKFFQGLTWQQVAGKMGKKATEASVRMEFQRFMQKR